MEKRIGKQGVCRTMILIILPLLTAFLALGFGRYHISPKEVLTVLVSGNSGTSVAARTVWNLRIPRILTALLVGAGLSVSGCAFQSLFANPLATPDTLGLASGASFGAVLGILCGFRMPGIQFLSFLMGVLAVVLTWSAGSGRNRGMHTVVLAGIMMGSLFNALISLVKYAADEESQLPAITYWLMGGFQNSGYAALKFGAPPILLGMLILLLLRWRMNLLPLSDEEGRASGVHMKRLRIVTVVCATAITASCVSMCGQVGWVGLLVPHMCRMKFGSNHLSLVPACISFGAVFMVVTDTIARTVSASEIPVSILTALIGAPFFIVLMRRSGGWKL